MIIGLSGYARSGKDTVADRLVTSHGFTRISFADALKETVYVLNPVVNGRRYAEIVDEQGLDAAKAGFPEVRRLLQFMGTEVGRQLWGEDFWVERLAMKVRSHHAQMYREGSLDLRVVIPDCRFPNEAEFVQGSTAGGRGQLWRIHRPGVGPLNDHPSETALDSHEFDAHLNNDQTIAALHEHVDYLVEALL